MNLRRLYPALRLLVCLGVLLSFSACNNRVNGGNRPQSNGEGILGRNYIASKDNSRIRCFYDTLAANHYLVTCHTVIFDELGEVKAKSYADNLTAQWSSLSQTAGPEAQVSCTDASDLLSTSCDVRTNGPIPTTYLANLELKSTDTGDAANLKAEIIVPYTAQMLGRTHLPDLQVPELSTASGAGSERVKIGIQTTALPLAGLTMNFERSYLVGSSLFLKDTNTQYLYRYDIAAKAFYTYAGGAPRSSTQTGTPVVATNTNRLRLEVDAVSLIAPTEDGLILIHSEVNGQRIELLPEDGAPRTLFTVPSVPGQGDIIQAPRDVFKLPGGDLIVVGDRKAFRVSNQGVQTLAGVGFPPSGHVETSAAASLALIIGGAAVYPDGGLLLIDLNQKRVLYVNNGIYQVLYKEPAREYCWDPTGVSAAVGSNGIGFLLVRDCLGAKLFRFEGTARREVIEAALSGTDGPAPGTAFPAVGNSTPIASYPLSYPMQFVGGVDDQGRVLLVSKQGVARVDVTTGTATMLLTTVTRRLGGVSGESAKNAFYDPLTFVNYMPDGKILAVSGGSSFLTLSPEADTVEPVVLTGSLGHAHVTTALVVSPSGKRFLHARSSIESKLYEISNSGVLNLLMTLPVSNNTRPAAMVAKSDTELYGNFDGHLKKIDLSDLSMTTVLSLPGQFHSLKPGSMSLGPDGALYVIKYIDLVRIFPLDGTAVIRPIFSGTQPLHEGGFVHEMELSSDSLSDKFIKVVDGGILFSEDDTASFLKVVGTATDGFPIYTYHGIFRSQSANPDCVGGLLGNLSTESAQKFQATLNAICPGRISGLTARMVGGVAQFVLARDFGGFGSLLLLGMPLTP